MERHLTFLVECRGAFGIINELKVRTPFFINEMYRNRALFFSLGCKISNSSISSITITLFKCYTIFSGMLLDAFEAKMTVFVLYLGICFWLVFLLIMLSKLERNRYSFTMEVGNLNSIYKIIELCYMQSRGGSSYRTWRATMFLVSFVSRGIFMLQYNFVYTSCGAHAPSKYWKGKENKKK